METVTFSKPATAGIELRWHLWAAVATKIMVVPRRYFACWSGLVCFVLGFMCSTAGRSGMLAAVTTSSSQITPPTILVTGGLGFIGSHVVEELTHHGFHVVIFDDMSNGRNFDVARNASAVLLKDVTNVDDLNAITMPIDYVVHLAAAISVVESISWPEKYHRTNVVGSDHVLAWALRHHVKRFVAASTSSIYGDVTSADLPLEEGSASGGISPYATSKFEMERLLEAYAKQGLPTTALRIFNVYGPRQDPTSPYSGVVSYFMDQAMRGADGRLIITGDGDQSRDFIFVKDVAVAVRLAVESSLPQFEAFNVCTGVKTTINMLVAEVLATCKSAATIEYGPTRPADVRESVCDPRKAREKLGFEAQYAFAEGISATWQWFKSINMRDIV
ncbi:hypothetical protein H310_02158 [Aphanomyces invadans]|uniref:NAD-dependent epimerase/dehydratase domain-containing protein n=1 Tax=Aphanomyces invadans TaxID=157072 RepID=A0A024UN27_9STRA|nr:hypothetical protein H310_02158 [Aphanomyces invadans]ETW07709.1 hypothetical protein H310_02158 [Aphanomyces invadans]|eukprot:XP_008863802.1 hypothetical protein H310_02158 [Aphanomyces invadans]